MRPKRGGRRPAAKITRAGRVTSSRRGVGARLVGARHRRPRSAAGRRGHHLTSRRRWRPSGARAAPERHGRARPKCSLGLRVSWILSFAAVVPGPSVSDGPPKSRICASAGREEHAHEATYSGLLRAHPVRSRARSRTVSPTSASKNGSCGAGAHVGRRTRPQDTNESSALGGRHGKGLRVAMGVALPTAGKRPAMLRPQHGAT